MWIPFFKLGLLPPENITWTRRSMRPILRNHGLKQAGKDCFLLQWETEVRILSDDILSFIPFLVYAGSR